jgi:hypothetical protein
LPLYFLSSASILLNRQLQSKIDNDILQRDDASFLRRYAQDVATQLNFFFFNTKMICVTIYLTTLEKTNEKLNGWLHSISWSIDSSGIKAKQIILDRSTRNNRIYYALFVLTLLIFIVNLPIGKNENEFYLCVEVFENIFGNWSRIPSFIYFATMSYLVYANFRLPFMLLYAILQTHIQIFLLTEHILHISDNFIDTRNGNIIIDDVLYQDKIKERLCLFTQQHCEIKRYVITILRIEQ